MTKGVPSNKFIRIIQF